MKRKLTVTLETIIDWDIDWDGKDKHTFDDYMDCDYDNIERPLNDLLDTGWKIKRKKVTELKDESDN